uniref:Bm12871 n=1 Tax=Brugia malayi TaxID=6279 RepID=A0A1I9G5V6_BRUMA|nr:Bm12871 [Brugia malayi]
MKKAKPRGEGWAELVEEEGDGQTGPGLGQGHGLGHGHEQGHGLESLCVKFVVMKCCSLIGSFTPSFLKSVLILCQKGDIFAYEPRNAYSNATDICMTDYSGLTTR